MSMDFGPIIEQLQRHLGQAEDARTLEALPTRRWVDAYADARVTTFVPIFLFRDVLDEVRQAARRGTGRG